MTKKAFSDAEIETAVQMINEHTGQALVYEETHVDAGNSYADLLKQGDQEALEQRVIAFCTEQGIDTGNLSPQDLREIALDEFRMEAGHIFGLPSDNLLTLDSYAVGEIEISLEGLGLSPELVAAAGPKSDAHIADNGLAYRTTDAVWYAVIDTDTLKQAIIDLLERRNVLTI